MAEYRTGSIVKCQVTGIEKYGAFVNIDGIYSGLIHISEISNGFVLQKSFYFDNNEKSRRKERFI